MISVSRLMNDDSNALSTSDYSDADIEFREVQDGETVSGKISNHTRSTPEDMDCLRRLENSVSNLESCIGTFHLNQEVVPSRSLIFSVPSCISPSKEDTLSDVDLEKFEREHDPSYAQKAFANQQPEAMASLSDFHNVGEVILSIRHRLDSFLKTNRENSIDQAADTSNKQTLEENISALKTELESYLKVINEKKEDELRRFSENMINEERILKMKKAFFRKEKLQTNFYETLGSNNYAIANNDSVALSTLNHNRDTVRVRSGFTLRNCYDNDYIFDDFSENSSVEFYTMLINEEKTEDLNDAPRFYPRERISLIFRDPEEVIKQWQNYQQHTKPKQKPCRPKQRLKSVSHDALWGFTLSSHQNQTLQLKLKKEQQTR